MTETNNNIISMEETITSENYNTRVYNMKKRVKIIEECKGL